MKKTPFCVLLWSPLTVTAFLGRRSWIKQARNKESFSQPHTVFMGLSPGAFTVELEKPLGIVLEERKAGTESGVLVKSLVEDGAASISGKIAPREILLMVDDTDVSNYDFDSIMNTLVEAPTKLLLTLSDGLGKMDIAKNLEKRLSQEEALLADSVVRAAVKEIRMDQRLGDLLHVEIIIGAGFRNDGKCLIRFFGIFSTDGVTTYSCNVSATGIRQLDGSIKIISLACAKDEGLGQTIDLIIEGT